MNGVDVKRFVRYFYDPQPKNDDMSGMPIWCLGREYASGPPPKPVSTTDHDDIVEIASSTDSHAPSETTISSSPELPASVPPVGSGSFDDASLVNGDNVPSLSNDPSDGGWPTPFLDDFESKIWMTYRSNFPPIPRSQDPTAPSGMTFSVRLRSLAEREGFSSDTGWGCMIRSGQSLLANALIVLQMGRDWRRRKSHVNEDSKVVALFADSPEAPFSIHKFVKHGASACGKHPGQWFGPSATASCIKSISPGLYLGVGYCTNLILGNWPQTIPPRACEFTSRRTRQTFTKIHSAPSHHPTPPTPPSNLPSSCLESAWAQTA
jgi:cysteine protease ATG4